MTPTLLGRMHTRIVLVVVLGIPITLPFCLLAFPFVPVPLAMLLIVLLVGLAMDPIYHLIQQRRWDHDWPVHLQLAAGLVELVLCLPLITGCGLVSNPLAILFFPVNYLLVWLAVFLMIQGPIRVLLPQWRYRGGEVWGHHPGPVD